MSATATKAISVPMAIGIAALFGGFATVLAVEFPYTSITPPTLSYFFTQLVIFGVQIAVFFGAGILVFGSPCWAFLRGRGVSGWRAAMVLGAILGLALGGAALWVAPIVIPMESCHAFDTCRESSLTEQALDILRFAAICGGVPSFTGLLLWRLTRAATS
jgi:hypothetical protein